MPVRLARILQAPILKMSTEEKEILEFLGTFREVYVSVVEVSRRVGARGRFNADRTWARSVLMRMQRDGLLESNEYGEFRLRRKRVDTDFLDALQEAKPDVELGDTTIIRLHDVA